MDTKGLILQELQETPEGLLDQVLNFVRFLKAEQERQVQEDQEDLADARAAREEAKEKGTISLQTLKQELGLSE